MENLKSFLTNKYVTDADPINFSRKPRIRLYHHEKSIPWDDSTAWKEKTVFHEKEKKGRHELKRTMLGKYKQSKGLKDTKNSEDMCQEPWKQNLFDNEVPLTHRIPFSAFSLLLICSRRLSFIDDLWKL